MNAIPITASFRGTSTNLGIFPPPDAGGVPPGAGVANAFTPTHAVLGGLGPYYTDPNCQTHLTDKQLNAMTSELLGVVDHLGFSYNPALSDNLGRALETRFNAIANATDVVHRSGDTMTGQLVTLAPQAPGDAANKGYVDAQDAQNIATTMAAVNVLQGQIDDRVKIAGDSMTGPLFLNPLIPNVPSMAATKEYVDREVARGGTFVDAIADGFTYGRMNNQWFRVLSLNGGTMTGPLVLETDPTSPMQAATKQYVDAHAGGGGGGIEHPTTPNVMFGSYNGAWSAVAIQTDATSDNQYYARRNGAWAVVPSGTGIAHAPSNGNWYASRNGAWEVFTPGGGGIPEAPAGAVYGRNGTSPGSWSTVVATTGGQMTGPLNISGAPGTASLHFNGTTGIADRYFAFNQNTIDYTGASALAQTAGMLSWNGNLQTTNGAIRAPNYWVGVYPDRNFGMFIENAGTAYQVNVLRLSQSMAFVLDFNTASYAFHVNGIPITSVDSGGTITIHGQAWKPGGGPWSDASDARIKTELGDYTHGLAEILKLRPVTYKFKGNDTPRKPKLGGATPYNSSKHRKDALAGTEFVGLTAQECETVMPELVKREEGYIDGERVDDLRSLDSNALIYALVNAVKELTARVAALEGARA